MQSLEIVLNGARAEVPEGTTVLALLERLALAPEQVAVERNRALVRKSEQALLTLAAGDVLEIVTLVGGG